MWDSNSGVPVAAVDHILEISTLSQVLRLAEESYEGHALQSSYVSCYCYFEPTLEPPRTKYAIVVFLLQHITALEW